MGDTTLESATLDTLAPSVAVIDESGEIVLTNSAWRSFGPEETDHLGINYLATTQGVDDEFASRAAEGLEAVLAGERDRFELEYPCHSPDQRQWFLLQATRFAVEGAPRVAVVHLDITERRLAEEATESALEDLEREHATLEHVLDRIDGLLPAVTDAAVGAPTRSALEERVCRALLEAEPYETAAFARLGVGGSDLEWREHRGGDRESLEAVATETAETGEVRTDAETAALPVAYGDVTYGVLAVGASPGAFERHELLVLQAIADTVATAINALEAKRLLVTDSVVALDLSVSPRDHALVALASATDGRVSYRGIRTSGELPVLFVHVEGGPPFEAIRDQGDLGSPTVLARTDDGTVLELAVADDLVEQLTEHAIAVRAIEATAEGLEIRVDLPTEAAARSLYGSLQDTYESVRVLGNRTTERPVETPADLAAGLLDSLTDRQLAALTRAVHAGYYEWPRGASGPDLAEAMDISRETFHQHLRAAEQKLLEGLLETGSR